VRLKILHDAIVDKAGKAGKGRSTRAGRCSRNLRGTGARAGSPSSP